MVVIHQTLSCETAFSKSRISNNNVKGLRQGPKGNKCLQMTKQIMYKNNQLLLS